MVNKNKLFMDAVSEDFKSAPKAGEGAFDSPETAAPELGLLKDRMKGIREVGKFSKRSQQKVSPNVVKIREKHKRRYDLLNENNCADLIEGFKETGKQEFAAIVRVLEDDPKYKFELILGARRHWTATYLGWDLLVETKELTDEEAFRLADVENRTRRDISDYERALDYKRALGKYYATIRQMAVRMSVDENWLSRYMRLTELPDQVIKAYSSIYDIKLRHALELMPLLKTPAVLDRVMKQAEQIEREAQERYIPGPAVFGRLIRTAREVKNAKHNRAKKQHRGD